MIQVVYTVSTTQQGPKEFFVVNWKENQELSLTRGWVKIVALLLGHSDFKIAILIKLQL